MVYQIAALVGYWIPWIHCKVLERETGAYPSSRATFVANGSQPILSHSATCYEFKVTLWRTGRMGNHHGLSMWILVTDLTPSQRNLPTRIATGPDRGSARNW